LKSRGKVVIAGVLLLTVGAAVSAGTSNGWLGSFFSLHPEKSAVDIGDQSASHRHHGPAAPDGRAALHAHDGARHPLGSAEFGGFKLDVTQVGGFSAGGLGTFEVSHIGTGDAPRFVTTWIGTADGVGSGRGLIRDFDPASGDHAHVSVPNPIPAGAALWIEYYSQNAGIVKRSFLLAPE